MTASIKLKYFAYNTLRTCLLLLLAKEEFLRMSADLGWRAGPHMLRNRFDVLPPIALNRFHEEPVFFGCPVPRLQVGLAGGRTVACRQVGHAQSLQAGKE